MEERNQAQFDIDLVRNFIAAIRKRGEAELVRVFDGRYGDTKMSTPLLAWVFSHRKQLEDSKESVEELIKLDLQRQKNTIGHYIFKDQTIRKYPEQEKLYTKATELIAFSWPEFNQLIEVIQPRLSFQTNDRQEFESESDAKTFGDIIYKMDSDCPAMWAEIIVHEVAHLYLNVLLATTKIDENVKLGFRQRKYSFQRRSERPLIGILHGVFAQSNILYFATRLFGQSNEIAIKKGALKTFNRFEKVFLQDKETVLREQLLFHDHVEGFVELADKSCAGMRAV